VGGGEVDHEPGGDTEYWPSAVLPGEGTMLAKKWVAVGLLAGVAVFSSRRPAVGQVTPDPVLDPLRATVSLFLEKVSAGSTQKAFDDLLKGSPLGTSGQAAARATLIEKTEGLVGLYGEYRAFEPVSSKRVGNNLVFLKYLYKCENFPVVWYFTFYRPPPRGDRVADSGSEWRVIIVRFDTALELLGLD
jgi:hypothetical protein